MSNLRKLDVLVAEKVFGAKVDKLHQTWGWRIDYRANNSHLNRPIISDFGVEDYELKNFSTDANFANDVINEISRQTRAVTVELQMLYDSNGWVCTFKGRGDRYSSSWAYGETMAEAVCKAAVMINEDGTK